MVSDTERLWFSEPLLGGSAALFAPEPEAPGEAGGEAQGPAVGKGF